MGLVWGIKLCFAFPYEESCFCCLQVTLSYGGFENRRNVVSIVGGFSLAEDPTRYSIDSLIVQMLMMLNIYYYVSELSSEVRWALNYYTILLWVCCMWMWMSGSFRSSLIFLKDMHPHILIIPCTATPKWVSFRSHWIILSTVSYSCCFLWFGAIKNKLN